MSIDRLPSGAYRYRKQIDGKKISLTFDHEPTKKEITLAVNEILKNKEFLPKKSMFKCAESYIEAKDNILSPSTKRSYQTLIRSMSSEFSRIDINDVSQIDVQKEINLFSKTHSPKTTCNYHGFIASFLGLYRPSLTLHTTLPQKVKYEPYTPSDEDIKRILEHSKGTKYHIPIQLGILGMRRSEICALTLDDLKEHTLSVNKAKVQNEAQKWEVKPMTKTQDGKRDIIIPDELRNEIIENNGIYEGNPAQLLYNLHKFQRELNIEKFRFHDLRVFFCSYCHSIGVPEAVILNLGGWKSSYVMKNVYRKAMDKDKKTYADKFAEDIFVTTS